MVSFSITDSAGTEDCVGWALMLSAVKSAGKGVLMQPYESQLSAVLEFPSSQFTGSWTQPLAPQESAVQGLPSSQFTKS